jgi:chromate transporter
MAEAIMEIKAEAAPRSAPRSVSFGEALRTWTRIGLQSFGGPAGQIAVMHKVLVEEKRWVSEGRFLHALNYCMLLPGPEAQQLATYIGWLLHRTLGGVVAGTLFVLPGFLVILGLSALYAGFRQVAFVDALFFGLKPAVLAIVVEAVIRIGKRSLKNGTMVALAAGAFVGIFFFGVPFPLIVLAAGVVGLIGARLWPSLFPGPVAAQAAAGASDLPVVDQMLAAGTLEHTRPSLKRAVRVVLLCLALWFGPVALLAAPFGRQSVFVAQGLFFSKAAALGDRIVVMGDGRTVQEGTLDVLRAQPASDFVRRLAADLDWANRHA